MEQLNLGTMGPKPAYMHKPDATVPYFGLPMGHYGAGAIDVPWLFENYSDKGTLKNPSSHYDCMTDDDVFAMPVGQLFRPDAAIGVWAVDAKLPEALEAIERWGFTYKTVAFTWVKSSKHGREHMGTGYWTRANPEMCLFATRGSPHRLDKGVRQLLFWRKKVGSALFARVREHSRKPPEALHRIERLVRGPYVELFARERRDGWDAWGKEVGKFTDRFESPPPPPGLLEVHEGAI